VVEDCDPYKIVAINRDWFLAHLCCLYQLQLIFNLPVGVAVLCDPQPHKKGLYTMKNQSKNSNLKNILVIGGGGREHAICDKLSQSSGVGKLYCIPGNAGIAQLAECHTDIAATDIEKIVDFVATHPDIYMTVVAPDDPLAMGLVDKLTAGGFRAFGPTAAAAQIEASKVFAKEFMQRHNIPTANYASFSDYAKAIAYVETAALPLVVKADGLALGKGVTICNTLAEAKDALKNTMHDNAFGSAGNSVVIEEFLTGFEASVLAFCDGDNLIPMVSAEDNKRVFNGDQGPNTGGMGTLSPSQKYTAAMAELAHKTIFLPTLEGMKKEGRPFKGVLYFGLIVGSDGVPKVIEYNARFGDPETQVVLPRLDGDLLEIFDACIDGTLNRTAFTWKENVAICVALASAGYPASYPKGKPITIGKMDAGVKVYHAGTAMIDNTLVTNGGRVLGVTATAKTLKEVREIVYKNIDNITFEGMHYRTDIGNK